MKFKFLLIALVYALIGCRRETHHAAPVPLSPDWSALGEEEYSNFGIRAMGAGDLNGDGYGDLIVGAPHWHNQRGKVYVYFGSAKGLGSKPGWTAQGEGDGEMFGDRVGQAGDVNGDHFGDLFVAAPRWKGGFGRCVVYLGSKHGPGAKPGWSVSPSDQGEQFADCTHPTGDLNGDGYDDLAVGAYSYDDARGRILLYRGSAKGLEKTPVWERKGEGKGDWYGYGVGAAGDVNGDGIDDFVSGGKYNDDAGHDAGKAYLHFGSKQGLAAAPDWAYKGRVPEANAGVRLFGAGDLNGDGFADLALSSPGSNGKLGELAVFFGSAKGLASTPDEVIHAPAEGAEFFGQGACPTGDLDGDGFDDLAVHGRGADGRGRAFIYRGSAKGLESSPSWVIEGQVPGDRFAWWIAPAGDLDGDGAPDLVIGAESQGPGRVYVIYGKQFNPSGKRSQKQNLNVYIWNKRQK